MRSPATSLSVALLITLVAAVACSSSSKPTPTPSPTASPTATVPSPSPTSAAPSPTVLPTQNSITATPTGSLFITSDDCASITRQLLPKVQVTVRDSQRSVTVDAELATSFVEQAQGLMCRSSVPDGDGMLFTFEAPRSGGFWMFNTYVPLDIIYSADNGDVDIKQMRPCPRDVDEDHALWQTRCALESTDYKPDILYVAALELPQGWLASLGFDIDHPSDISITY